MAAGPIVPLSRSRRADMARAVCDAQREVYAAEGVEGDFDDAERWLRDDATEDELLSEYARYVTNARTR